ncbi:hypothetical protein NQZ68_025356 [Dissostichus eleginoides]|nr:hypothetical protein NQZ68_025356 [Dissostichus eleginoides]
MLIPLSDDADGDDPEGEMQAELSGQNWQYQQMLRRLTRQVKIQGPAQGKLHQEKDSERDAQEVDTERPFDYFARPQPTTHNKLPRKPKLLRREAWRRESHVASQTSRSFSDERRGDERVTRHVASQTRGVATRESRYFSRGIVHGMETCRGPGDLQRDLQRNRRPVEDQETCRETCRGTGDLQRTRRPAERPAEEQETCRGPGDLQGNRRPAEDQET